MIRFTSIYTHGIIQAPGGRAEDFLSEAKGYEIWCASDSPGADGVWIALGEHKQWLGPNTIKSGIVKEGDAPKAPSELEAKAKRTRSTAVTLPDQT